MNRKIFARVIVALLLGIATGYGVGKSLAKDAAEGRALTLETYIADFEHHKEELSKSAMPMGVAIVSGIVMIVVVFGVYEVLVLGVDKLLEAVDRRRNAGVQPGTPPPW